jgi:hypothetical protein
MRKSDILAGSCQGGPWAARTLSSTNGLVWVPDVSLGCYHFLFEEGATGAPDTTGTVYPPDLQPRIAPMVRRPGDLTPATSHADATRCLPPLRRAGLRRCFLRARFHMTLRPER